MSRRSGLAARRVLVVGDEVRVGEPAPINPEGLDGGGRRTLYRPLGEGAPEPRCELEAVRRAQRHLQSGMTGDSVEHEVSVRGQFRVASALVGEVYATARNSRDNVADDRRRRGGVVYGSSGPVVRAEVSLTAERKRRSRVRFSTGSEEAAA